MRDYNTLLDKLVTEMEQADQRGDSKTIFRIVKLISGLMTIANGKAPTVDKEGNLILDQQRMAVIWRQFLEGKFAVTDTE